MSTEYTPSTDDVCKTFVYSRAGDRTHRDQEYRDQFDRWLAAHDRAVKAEAWDEGYSRAKASHCDAPPSVAYCDVTDPNPYRANEMEGDW